MVKEQETSKEFSFANTMSRLKRATGIPGLRGVDDLFDRGNCFVHTSDLESAQILGNLIAHALMGLHRHTEKYWSLRHDGDATGLHGMLEVQEQRNGNGYVIKFGVPEEWLDRFEKNIDERIKLLLTPDTPVRAR